VPGEVLVVVWKAYVEGDLRLGGVVDLSGFSSGVSVGNATHYGRLKPQEVALTGDSATSRVSLTEIRLDDASGNSSVVTERCLSDE
jgi:hypothetical protein